MSKSLVLSPSYKSLSIINLRISDSVIPRSSIMPSIITILDYSSFLYFSSSSFALRLNPEFYKNNSFSIMAFDLVTHWNPSQSRSGFSEFFYWKFFLKYGWTSSSLESLFLYLLCLLSLLLLLCGLYTFFYFL